MAKEIPKIEPRNFDDLLKEFKALVPFYTPEWRLEEKGKGADLALVKIFIQFLGTIYHRLNRLPEKHFISFLHEIGIKRIPAQSAFVPVTFLLSEGTGEPVLITAGTQVAAGDVIFETEKNLLASPAKLVNIFHTDGEKDAIFPCPANIISGEPVLPFKTKLVYPAEEGDTEIFVESNQDLAEGDILFIGSPDGEYGIVSFMSDTGVTLTGKTEFFHGAETTVQKVTHLELFRGKNLQEHLLYLGHNTLFEITETAKITLDIQPVLFDITGVSWHYYGDNEAGITGWHSLKPDASPEENQIILSKEKTGEIIEFEINSINSRWLRCTVPCSKISLLQEVKIDTVEAQISSLEEEAPSGSGILPDMVFCNEIPVDPGKISQCKPLYPFGKTPILYDTFYIASQEVFSRKNAEIEITFDLSVPGVPGVKGVLLSWEYHGENGWSVIKILEDTVDNFTAIKPTDSNGEEVPVVQVKLKFICPEDIIPIDVNGKESYWIRGRLLAGDYGREKFVKVPGTETWEPNYDDINPPIIVQLSISYTHEFTPEFYPLDYCLTYNNLEFIDRSTEIKEPGKSFTPFLPWKETHRVFYLAFDKKLEKGPVILFFAIAEKPVSPEQVPTIHWEYYNESRQWQRLDVLDATMSLTRTGVIEFVFPPDFRETRIFDTTAYWVRAVYLEEEKTGADEIAIPTITDVFLNTTWALQSETISAEILGSGDGTANQVFSFTKTPVTTGSEEIWVNELKTISSEEQRQILEENQYQVKQELDEKENLTEFWIKWKPIDSILNASSNDRCYEIDNVSGDIMFGDGINGKILPTGTDNIKADYCSGGGKQGNLPVFEITELKTSIPFLDKAFNPLAAGGGTDTETIEHVMERGPYLLKHRNRAITVEDFEQLAFQAAGGIARVKCLPNTNDKRKSQDGRVTVIVIPQTDEEKPRLSLQMKYKVEQHLQQRAAYRMVEKDYFRVIGPVYVNVSVYAWLAATSIEMVPLVEKACYARLKDFLNPLSGGSEKRGWDFGKIPCFSDFYALLEKIKGVDHVVDLLVKLNLPDPENTNAGLISEYILTPENPEDFPMPPYAVICSGRHKIEVSV
ncbi:MAG: putative baseplate assembly protein [Candidatus Aminicenantes bacterium]|nr:putative baseplate assembly protein [Candidatus Aminicenantes bacterium]NIM81862.1 putative baseplate assembly protein [Candidatus Aminicenantes bacterium]NIN21239.1 putative baseplate assembly protein [Candidatus Aminicenantes bacterium]NIN45060.1 putative baseplate assembly protein [Candidatus Aminicenantes bacterium]NIN87877.1 putative baseplate assembly protein [Candidatus Aminicenantes bacterium]